MSSNLAFSKKISISRSRILHDQKASSDSEWCWSDHASYAEGIQFIQWQGFRPWHGIWYDTQQPLLCDRIQVEISEEQICTGFHNG